MLNVFSSGSHPSRKMHIPKKTPPTRRSTVSDSWVLLPDAVSIGNHTEQRSPQLNSDNMSSHQFADASVHGLLNNSSSSSGAAPSPSPELSFEDYHYHHHHLNTAAPFVPPFFPRKPESNGGSSSTETAGTDDTLTIDLHHHYPLTNPTFHPAAAMPPFPVPHGYEHPAGSYRYHHHHQLTQSNMDLHQHDLALRYTSSIPGWVAAAGTGRRLLPSPPCSSVTPSGGSLYMYMDMDMDMEVDVDVTVGAVDGGGIGGGGGGGGPQPAAAVAAAAGEEGMAMVAAAGAWCEGALGPVMVMRLMEEVEEEWFL